MSDEQAIGETGSYAQGHRGMGFDDRRSIANAFIKIVAEQLHYFDRIRELDLTTCKAADIAEITDGSIDRYRNDPVFYAKVNSIVCLLMQEIQKWGR